MLQEQFALALQLFCRVATLAQALATLIGFLVAMGIRARSRPLNALAGAGLLLLGIPAYLWWRSGAAAARVARRR